MAFAKTTLALCLWTTTFVVAASASAQSVSSGERAVGQTCTDGSAISSTSDEVRTEEMRLAPAVPVEDVQWCVDRNDPRCSPDPAGAPAAHLAHAGDAARAARTLNIAAAPTTLVSWRDQAKLHVARGIVLAIERPPQSR